MTPNGPDDRLELYPSGRLTQAGLLFDASRCGPTPAPRMLDAASYGPNAQRIAGRGGRGSAWFVHGRFGDGVLRHYRRGGWLARFDSHHYLWSGIDQTRCVREYRLLRALHSQGLPVPPPIAAGWWREGLLYRQALITERLPDVRSAAELLAKDPAHAPWQAIGQTIARFHLAGVRHADLNAHNILVDITNQVWLIDFDRGRQAGVSGEHSRRNLERLLRSLRKLGADTGETAWRQIRDAWLKAMAQAPSLSSR